ncbi:MAG TPA: xanthine dehydrogenase family protein molybdopterin-binding subunit [Candidatus Acidoferrales bacterium]|nr:xanthine dehydrogenase family protein molybdopterin-binding subunit [Candidatus Acidoferrales bacterium]
MQNQQQLNIVGKRVNRIDSMRKVLGKPIYTTDFIPSNALHVKLVTAGYPHAKIVNIDTSTALRVKGVCSILTARDVPGVNVSACIIPDRPLFAHDKVRCIGDVVAAVVADDVDVAAEAAATVKVEYEKLPVISSTDESLGPDAVMIHEKGNIVRHLRLLKGDVEQGFASSDLIVENSYTTQCQDPTPIEPEAGFSQANSDGSITFTAPMQNPHYVRGGIARIIGASEEKVRVIQADTGGTFGTKSDEVVIDIGGITAIASSLTHRPVSLTYTREESMIMHSKRHPFTIKHKTGVTRDGLLRAAKIDLVADTGAYASNGPLVLLRAIFHATGPYVIPNVLAEARCVYTNNTVAGSFRGFGNPQAHFAAESQMDAIAEKLNMDPLEFRLKNILRPGTSTASGQVLDDSVGLEECARAVRTRSGWDRKRVQYKADHGKTRRGIGVAFMYHGNSIGPEGNDTATTTITITNTKVSFRVGLVEYGSGSRSGLAQIIAEILGVPLDRVTDEPADTGTTTDSGGTFASRTTVMGGRAVLKAAQALRERLDKVAAEILHCDASDIRIQSGIVSAGTKPRNRLTFEQLVGECERRGVGLTESTAFTATGCSFDESTCQGTPYLQYTFGAVVAEVEVDYISGLVRATKFTTAYDVGKAINPAGLEGQIEGGTAQALGLALMEELVHKDGFVTNPNFAAYYIPTSVDVPSIRSNIIERPGCLGPFGAKAMGEPPIVAPAAALGNAVFHATGVRIRDLPMTPSKVLLALTRSAEQ